MKTVLKQLLKMQEILSSEAKWTKNTQARDIYGKDIYLESKDATSWCITGALLKANASVFGLHTIEDEVYLALLAHIPKERSTTNPYPAISFRNLQDFNDRLDTTYEDVMLLISKAIQTEQEAIKTNLSVVAK